MMDVLVFEFTFYFYTEFIKNFLFELYIIDIEEGIKLQIWDLYVCGCVFWNTAARAFVKKKNHYETSKINLVFFENKDGSKVLGIIFPRYLKPLCIH